MTPTDTRQIMLISIDITPDDDDQTARINFTGCRLAPCCEALPAGCQDSQVGRDQRCDNPEASDHTSAMSSHGQWAIGKIT